MRGENDKYAQAVKAEGRNTPTCVGKTPLRHWARKVLSEHPHMRGENHTAQVS